MLFRAMLSKLIKILLFTLPFYLGGSQEVFSEEPVPSKDEAALLELINEARKDPLGMAESLGIDRETVLQDLPELNAILTEGLAPLEFNGRLYEAASGHTEEMLSNSYYSHNSLDGRTYGERIRKAGYLAAVCGESLGMVAFQNFMDTDEAVMAIFESIFLAELDPETTEERNILNPEITEAGIVLGSGSFTAGGSTLNVYLSTLDFGKPVAETEAIELLLVSMLNAARNDPRQALLSAGIDQNSAARAYGTMAFLSIPPAPLAWNDKLHGTAKAHNRDMLDQGYFDIVSPDGSTPFERVEATGYDPARVGESLGLLDVTQVDGPLDAARRLYEIILKHDVDPQSNAQRNIFSPSLSEIGIGVEKAYRDLGGGDEQSLFYVVVADFAQPLEQRSFVMGTVYEDHNKNGVFDEDEGIPGLKITLNPGKGATGPESISGPTGRYQISISDMPTGLMNLYVEREGDVFGPFDFFVRHLNENVLRNLRIESNPAKPELTIKY